MTCDIVPAEPGIAIRELRVKRLLPAALLGIAALAAPPASAAPPKAGVPPAEPDAPALISRMLDAHGGWEAYNKLGDMRVQYRFHNASVDPNAFPLRTATLRLGAAKQVRIDYLRGTEPVVMGFDGQQAWMAFGGVASSEEGAIAQAAFSTRMAAWILRLPFVLHEGGFTAAREGSAPRAAGQGTWDKVRVQFPDGWQVLYINQETSLLERAEWSIPEQDNRTELADFEAFDTSGPIKLVTTLVLRESDGHGALAGEGTMKLSVLKREFGVHSTDATYKAPPVPAAAQPAGGKPR